MRFPVKSLFRSILIITTSGLFIITSGLLLRPLIKSEPYFTDLLLLTVFFTLISVSSAFIFIRGQSKEPQSQAMHTLVSLSIKFLMELIFALLWFLVAKKTSSQSVIMFFVLYLTFSLILVLKVLKTLKDKTL